MAAATHLPQAMSQHFGIVAVILLRLDARPAEWVSVAALAGHLGTSEDTVRHELEHLNADRLITVRRAACTSAGPGGHIEFARANPAGCH